MPGPGFIFTYIPKHSSTLQFELIFKSRCLCFLNASMDGISSARKRYAGVWSLYPCELLPAGGNVPCAAGEPVASNQTVWYINIIIEYFSNIWWAAITISWAKKRKEKKKKGATSEERVCVNFTRLHTCLLHPEHALSPISSVCRFFGVKMRKKKNVSQTSWTTQRRPQIYRQTGLHVSWKS